MMTVAITVYTVVIKHGNISIILLYLTIVYITIIY